MAGFKPVSQLIQMGILNFWWDLHSGFFSECGMQQFNPNKTSGVNFMKGIWMKFQCFLHPQIRQPNEAFQTLNSVKLM